MLRWLLLVPVVCSCAAGQLRPELSPTERAEAIERGRALERSAPELEASPEGGSYRLLHVTLSSGPRLHPERAVSILVLSGNVRLQTTSGDRTLEAGQSVQVPRGVPYELENRDDDGSSLYLLFAPPEPLAGMLDRVSLTDARTP